MTRKCNQQLLFWQLEPENNPVRVKLVKESKNNSKAVLKYIEDKIQIQNHLEQKITEKRLDLERKREREAAKEKLRRKDSFSSYFPEEDFLVQTDCVSCGNLRLLRIDRPICTICEKNYDLGGVRD